MISVFSLRRRCLCNGCTYCLALMVGVLIFVGFSIFLGNFPTLSFCFLATSYVLLRSILDISYRCTELGLPRIFDTCKNYRLSSLTLYLYSGFLFIKPIIYSSVIYSVLLVVFFLPERRDGKTIFFGIQVHHDTFLSFCILTTNTFIPLCLRPFFSLSQMVFSFLLVCGVSVRGWFVLVLFALIIVSSDQIA